MLKLCAFIRSLIHGFIHSFIHSLLVVVSGSQRRWPVRKLFPSQISSYPSSFKGSLHHAEEPELRFKCMLANEKLWNVQSWHTAARSASCPGGRHGGSQGASERESEREIIHINCKRCHRGQISPEALTASFCVKFLDREPPVCCWILNGNQRRLNKCLPSLFHYCELIRLYLSNFWSWQNVNLSGDFSLLFRQWPAALRLACGNNLNLSPQAAIIVTLLACKLFN